MSLWISKHQSALLKTPHGHAGEMRSAAFSHSIMISPPSSSLGHLGSDDRGELTTQESGKLTAQESFKLARSIGRAGLTPHADELLLG